MTTLADYLAFAKSHPTLFVNPPEAGFTILLDEADIHKAELQMTQWLRAKESLRSEHMWVLFTRISMPWSSEMRCVFLAEDWEPTTFSPRHAYLASRNSTGIWNKRLNNDENAQIEMEVEIGARISL